MEECVLCVCVRGGVGYDGNGEAILNKSRHSRLDLLAVKWRRAIPTSQVMAVPCVYVYMCGSL